MGWASGMAAGVRLGEAVNAAREKKKEGLVAEEIAAFDAAQAEQAAAFKKQQESDQTTASIQAAFNNGGIGAGPSQNMSAVPQAPNTLAGMGLATPPTDTAPQQSPMPAPTRVEAPMSVLDQIRAREKIYRARGLTDQADKLSQQATEQQRFDIQQQQFETTTGLAREQLELTTRAADTTDKRNQFELAQAQAQAEREAKQKEGVLLLQGMLATNQADAESIGKLYSEYGVDPKIGNEIVTGFYNISKQDVARKQEQLALKTAELNLTGLLELHKEDVTITPGRHFDYEQKNGKIILSEIDTKTGEKVRELSEFGSTAELESSLRSLATGYGTAVESLANTAKIQRAAAGEAAIEYAKISADLAAVDGGIKEKLIAEIGDLQTDIGFLGAPRSEQEQRISDIYKAANVPYSGTMTSGGDYGDGDGDGDGDGTTPPPAGSAEDVRKGLKRLAEVDTAAAAKKQALLKEAEALIADFTPQQLDKVKVSDELKAAIKEAYAAKRPAYLESLSPAQRAFATGGLRCF